jgi:hypothetical protein
MLQIAGGRKGFAGRFGELENVHRVDRRVAERRVEHGRAMRCATVLGQAERQ